MMKTSLPRILSCSLTSVSVEEMLWTRISPSFTPTCLNIDGLDNGKKYLADFQISLGEEHVEISEMYTESEHKYLSTT